MRNRYNSSYFLNEVSNVTTFISLFHKNEQAVVPSINIIQPIANDVIHLANGGVAIKVKVEDIAKIDEVAMDIKSQSGTILFSDKEEAIENHSYTFIENFYPPAITKKTRMKLHVAFMNELRNLKSKTIKFYVSP